MIEILDCPFSDEIKGDLIKWFKLDKQKHSSGLVLKSKEHTEPETPEIKRLFNWIEDEDGAPKIKGFIAQENLDKFPEAYHLNEDDRYWFSKSEMIPYLMKALQEEIEKREEIEAKYNALEARISALESDK